MAVWIMVHKAPTHQLLTRFMDGDAFTRNLFEIIVEELYEAAVEVPMLHLMANLEKQSDHVLDHLAWQFHVDFYDAKFERHKKIAVIRNAYQSHKYKGTPYALDLVFDSLGFDGHITEWFEDDANPYTFKANINVFDVGINEDTYKMFERLIRHYKNVRSWLEEIIINLNSHNQIYVGSTLEVGHTLTIYPSTPEHLTITSPIYSDSATHSITTLTIGGPHEEI